MGEEVVKKASHLPERCRAMLVDSLPLSLAVPADERLPSQDAVVAMIEETLHAVKSSMEADIVAEDAKLDNVKSKMSELANTAREAETALATQNEALQIIRSSLADAIGAADASRQILMEQRSIQKLCDAKLTSAQQDKSALETAFKDHFQTPMEGKEGPNFKELEPFLQNIGIEASLLTTLPATCAKHKDTRGNFDDVVLQELEKALLARIATLSDVVAAETPAAAEREVAVQNAETECNAKTDARGKLEIELETAQKDQIQREAELVNARMAVNGLQMQLELATGLRDHAKATLALFEGGPLAGFMSYKSKRAIAAEAAPAGA